MRIAPPSSVVAWMFALIALLAVRPIEARAEPIDGVRAMIDAAIAEGDPEQVAIVIALARKVSPEDAALFDTIAEDFAAAQAPTEAASEMAAVPAPDTDPIPVSKSADVVKLAKPPDGFFEHWSGQGEIGGFRNTGNSKNTGISAALGLKRAGRDWSARIQANFDLQRSQGETTRERYFVLAEPQFSIGNHGFAYLLAQWERDRFRGLASRSAMSSGVGYKAITGPELQLEIKFGPAWRRTVYIEPDRTGDRVIAALAASNIDWKISDSMTMRQDMNAYLGSDNNSYSSLTALELALTSKLRASVSYLVEHDTNPPAEALNTDTLTRFSLIYGF